jgi:hypothetical protein
MLGMLILGVRTRLTTQGRPVVGCCEHCTGVSDFIKSGELTDDMSGCWVCNDCAPWNWLVYFIISGCGGNLFVQLFLVGCVLIRV